MTNKPEYDICIIGGGAGGLVVAAGAATLGAKVILVEKRALGGDCLHFGCIPSKTLIHSATVVSYGQHADGFGIYENHGVGRVHHGYFDFAKARNIEHVTGVAGRQ